MSAQIKIEKLNGTSLKKLKPTGKRYRAFFDDKPGLFALVGVSGNISFQYKYQLVGLRREIKIGNYPARTMQNLLAEYGTLVDMVKRGIDPLRERELEALEAADNPTFKAFAERFLVNYVQAKLQPKTITEYTRHIEKTFTPVFGKMKLTEIKRKQIIRLIEKSAKDAPIQANRKLATLKKMFSYAVDVGVLDHSPAAGIKPPAKENVKDRVLTLHELATLFKVLEAHDNRDTRDILQLITLTAQRPGEVAEMRISQLKEEADGTWWSMSGGETKNKTAHRVYLNNHALQIIQDRIKDYGLTNYIFPATKLDGSASHMRKDVTVSRVRKVMPLIEAEGIEKFTAHDLRRSAATGIAQLGHSAVVPDILNHKPQGITRQVYDKYSRQPEIKLALVSWGETIQRAVDGTQADVVQITQKQ